MRTAKTLVRPMERPFLFTVMPRCPSKLVAVSSHIVSTNRSLTSRRKWDSAAVRVEVGEPVPPVRGARPPRPFVDIEGTEISRRTLSRHLGHLGAEPAPVHRPDRLQQPHTTPDHGPLAGPYRHRRCQESRPYPRWRWVAGPRRGSATANAVKRRKTAGARAGYVYLHSAIDAYSHLDRDREWQLATIGQHVNLRSGFTPIDRTRPGQRSPFFARTLAPSTISRL